MRKLAAVPAIVMVAGLGLAACGSSGPCLSTAAQQALSHQAVTDDTNATNGTPIPAGAAWPQRAADLAANPQAVDQAAVNTLYWDRQAQDAENDLSTHPWVC